MTGGKFYYAGWVILLIGHCQRGVFLNLPVGKSVVDRIIACEYNKHPIGVTLLSVNHVAIGFSIASIAY